MSDVFYTFMESHLQGPLVCSLWSLKKMSSADWGQRVVTLILEVPFSSNVQEMKTSSALQSL